MTAHTVTVTIQANLANGAGLANGKVRFTLTKAEIDGNEILPVPIDVALDGSGFGTVNLWPNARGTLGSQYRVEFFDSDSVRWSSGLVTVPDANCNLHDLVPPA